MAQKAILFDGGRCTGCQACAAACGKARRAPLPGADGALGESTRATADAYERIPDVDGSAVLAVTLRERTVEPHGLVWEFGRKSCVHCASAPCAEVCPTGALERDEETGLVLANDGRCVSCFLCSLACPTDVPRPGGQGGAVSKCDGCVGRVRNDAAPLCVEACPLDALAWGDREDIVAQANERVARLRERGFERACVLGVGEQGGHGVVQVLKYGVEGSEHAPLAATGETPWISGVKMAGPVSLGILGVMGAAAVGTLAWETHREQQSRATAKAAPISMVLGIEPSDEKAEASNAADAGAFADGKGDAAAAGYKASDGVRGADEFESDAYLDGDFTDEDAAREAEERRVREAEEAEARARAAAARIVAPTPAAAAAATAAEAHLYPVAFAEDAEDDYDDALSDGFVDVGSGDFDDVSLPFVDELGDTGEIPVIEVGDEADDASTVDELGDTGEIPVIDEVGDTGELYNVEDFQRLLAADIVAHHLSKKAAEEDSPEEADPSGEEGPLEEADLSEEDPSGEANPSEEGVAADGEGGLSGEDIAEADVDSPDEGL